MTQFFQEGNSAEESHSFLLFFSYPAGKKMASHEVTSSLIRKQRFLDLTPFA